MRRGREPEKQSQRVKNQEEIHDTQRKTETIPGDRPLKGKEILRKQ